METEQNVKDHYVILIDAKIVLADASPNYRHHAVPSNHRSAISSNWILAALNFQWSSDCDHQLLGNSRPTTKAALPAATATHCLVDVL